MAMEAISAVLFGAGIVFGEEKGPAALFPRGKLGLAPEGAVEFGIEAGQGEEKVFDGEADLLPGDRRAVEGAREERGMIRGGSSFATTRPRFSSISAWSWMGMRAWARRDGARPSQKKKVFQARLSSGMAWRVPGWPRTPMLNRRDRRTRSKDHEHEEQEECRRARASARERGGAQAGRARR